MIFFERHAFSTRGQLDHAMPHATWDYLDAHGPLNNLFLITCPSGHTRRAITTTHSVDHDGNVSPSYVCTEPGCGFHDKIRLVGWDSDERHKR